MSAAPVDPAPLALSHAHAAALCRRAGIDIDARLSPLRPQAAELTGPDDPTPITPELIARLTAAAQPRRLVVLTVPSAGEPYVLTYLAGAHGVLSAVASDTHVHLGPVQSIGQFVARLCDLLGAPEHDPRPTDVLSGRLLGVVSDLLTAAPDPAGADPIPGEQALAILARHIDPAVAPDDALQALVRDRVLVRTGEAVAFDETWARDFSYLWSRGCVEVASAELQDTIEGLWSPRSIVVYGEAGNRRLAVLPAGAGSPTTDGRFVRMQPFDRRTLAPALVALLTNPWSPPRLPTVAAPTNAGEWLTPAGLDHGSEAEERWRCDSARQLRDLAAAGDAAAAALLAPAITLHLGVRAGQQAQADSTQLSLAGGAGAEWHMHGSRVRWRALSDGEVRARIDRLLPAHDSAMSQGGPISVTPAELTSSIAGDPPPQWPSELSAGDSVRWCSVTALRRTDRGLAGCELLFAVSGGSTTWRFANDGAEIVATPTDRAELLQEVVDALNESVAPARVDQGNATCTSSAAPRAT